MNTTIDKEKNIDIDDYFLLAGRNWNERIEDYTAIGDSATLIKYFDNYVDAEFAFKNGAVSVFPELKGKDIKLDLIHVRYGINRLVLSRIVF